ncbi:MAG TPA: MFS transporter [Thermoanaerobaculia bacterium]|jgi:MFS family permease
MPNRPADPVRVARWGLFVLTFVNLFNYLDRFMLAAVAESLKRPFPEGLGFSDTELGALATGFILVYMLTSPVFGTLGDRGRRPPLIAAGVAIWSVATALGGFARGFVSLFLARSTVGVGEAAYGTVSPALLADYFPVEQRGRVFAVFSAAIPIGSAAGYMLGGFVDSRLGWRAAFFVAGVPGLLLAWLTSRLFDPPRGAQEGGTAHAAGHGVALGRQALAAYAALLRNVPYTLTVLGYAAYTFALGALAFWTPAFLERERGLTHTDATVQFGAIVVVTGFVGTFVGGWLGDRLLRRFRESYLWVSGVSTLAAVPFAWMAFTAHGRVAYTTAIVIAEVLVFFSTGPVNSAIINVVEPERRAMAVALSILAIHLLGDVPSPPLVGLVSDHSSLGRALLILPVAFGVSGLIWIWAAWRGETLLPQPPLSQPPSRPPGERGLS